MASTAEQREETASTAGQATVRVVSRRFGTFDVPVASILHFAQGLVGFPKHRRYVILEHRSGSPFKWMLSLDDPDLAFAVAHPGELVADYTPPLGLASRLLGTATEDIALFVLVTIPPDPTCMTVNLMAPVVVDMRTRQARQIVLDDPRCPPDHRVVREPAATQP
jgi:flagellar assembly factor FliW